MTINTNIRLEVKGARDVRFYYVPVLQIAQSCSFDAKVALYSNVPLSSIVSRGRCVCIFGLLRATEVSSSFHVHLRFDDIAYRYSIDKHSRDTVFLIAPFYRLPSIQSLYEFLLLYN